MCCFAGHEHTSIVECDDTIHVNEVLIQHELRDCIEILIGSRAGPVVIVAKISLWSTCGRGLRVLRHAGALVPKSGRVMTVADVYSVVHDIDLKPFTQTAQIVKLLEPGSIFREQVGSIWLLSCSPRPPLRHIRKAVND